MSLKERVSEDMKSAMRARETARLSAVRLLLAAIKQREVDERKTLSDAEVVAVIDKMLKQRRDSIEQYEAAQRQDLADAEKFEVSVLRGYMPQALCEAEIEAAVAKAIAETRGQGPAGYGQGDGRAQTRAGRAGRHGRRSRPWSRRSWRASVQGAARVRACPHRLAATESGARRHGPGCQPWSSRSRRRDRRKN